MRSCDLYAPKVYSKCVVIDIEGNFSKYWIGIMMFSPYCKVVDCNITILSSNNSVKIQLVLVLNNNLTISTILVIIS